METNSERPFSFCVEVVEYQYLNTEGKKKIFLFVLFFITQYNKCIQIYSIILNKKILLPAVKWCIWSSLYAPIL